jgi:hypothetical protein
MRRFQTFPPSPRNGELRPLTVVRGASVCRSPVIAGDICRLSLSPQEGAIRCEVTDLSGDRTSWRRARMICTWDDGPMRSTNERDAREHVSRSRPSYRRSAAPACRVQGRACSADRRTRCIPARTCRFGRAADRAADGVAGHSIHCRCPRSSITRTAAPASRSRRHTRSSSNNIGTQERKSIVGGTATTTGSATIVRLTKKCGQLRGSRSLFAAAAWLALVAGTKRGR